MSYLRNPKRWLPLLLLVLVAAAPLPASAQSKSDVNKARDEEQAALQALREADAELEAGLEELERIEGQLYNLQWRIGRLGDAIDEYGTNVTNLKERAQLLVVEAYTTGGRNMVATAFTAGSIQELITSQALYDAATTRDLGQLDQLAAVSRQMDRLTDDLEVKKSEAAALEAAQADAVQALAEIQAKAAKVHADAKAKYASLYAKYQAEQRRRAAIEAARKSGAAAGIPSQTKGVACPFPGSYFIDSWGYPRSGGRLHHGTDMMGPYGARLYAMQSGSIRISSHYLGGKQLYIHGDDGITYYYAHLSGYASGLRSGQRVGKGQVVGYNGTSGNASTPHLHLGVVVGGVYVNPYPTVRAVC